MTNLERTSVAVSKSCGEMTQLILKNDSLVTWIFVFWNLRS